MISAAEALERAHDAIAGKAFHDAPGDIVVTREGSRYTVTFSSAKKTAVAAAEPSATRAVVDAETAAVLEVEHSGTPPPDPQLTGFISARRAFDVGLERLRESGLYYDPNGTTSVVLSGGRYAVTFPNMPPPQELTEQSAYAAQIWIDARTGAIVKSLMGA